MEHSEQLFLPPINEKTWLAIEKQIAAAPPELVDRFQPVTSPSDLVNRARGQEKNNPREAIINYLHAATLYCGSQNASWRIKGQDFVNKAISIAINTKNPKQAETSLSAMAKLGSQHALLWLGQLYHCQKKFDKAETAYRRSDNPMALYLLGRMYDHELNHETKACLYYLAAGKCGIGSAYKDFAKMNEAQVFVRKNRGCTYENALHSYIASALSGYTLAACYGDKESMKSLITLADYAERECNHIVPTQQRMAAYQTLLNNPPVPVEITDSYSQFVASHPNQTCEPLSQESIGKIIQQLDTNSRHILSGIKHLNEGVERGDPYSQCEWADRIFWCVNPSDAQLAQAVRLYCSAANNPAINVETKSYCWRQIQEICQDSHRVQARAELLFAIIEHKLYYCLENKPFDFQNYSEKVFKDSCLEYIALHHYKRLEKFMQQGNPVALYIGSLILNHQALAEPEMSEKQRAMLTQELQWLQQAYNDGAFIANKLRMEQSYKLANYYRTRGENQKAYEVLVPIVKRDTAGHRDVPDNHPCIQEFMLLCLSAPCYLIEDFFCFLESQCKFKDDVRARVFATYADLYYGSILEKSGEERLKKAYDYVRSILADEKQREYFFTHCPNFVKKLLRKACERHDAHACYVYCLSLFFGQKLDEKAAGFLKDCADQNDQWVSRMREEFTEICSPNSAKNDQLSCSYCQLLSCADECKRNEAVSSLQVLAQRGNVRACCELFVLGCAKNDETVCDEMFLLIKNNKVEQKAALKYFKERAQEKLQQFAATNMKAAYLYALIQHISADECKEKNVQWCSLARSAYDNFVHAHKGQYPCEKKIALIGCDLIDYYQQQGDMPNMQAIKATMSQFCKIDQITSRLIDKLSDPTIQDKSAETAISLLDELAVQKNLNALKFVGQAFAAGKKLPSGYCIQVDREKALIRLNDLLKLKPDDSQTCYEVAQLMIAQGTCKDQNDVKKINQLLSQAKSAGISDADRLLLIMKLNDKRMTEEARTNILAQLKKYADEGDQEAKSIIVNTQKSAREKEVKGLFRLIDGLHSTSDQITHALSRLAERAKDNTDIQWQLIDWYCSQKKLPSGYVCRQDQKETLRSLFDYMGKVKSNPQASKYLLQLLSELPEDSVTEQYEIAYKLLHAKKQGETFDSNELRCFAYICYGTHRYHEALELFNALTQSSPTVSWLQACCYLHDEPVNEANFELALNALTKALCMDRDGKLVLDEFPEAPFIIQKLDEKIQSPRATALLARLIYVAKLDMTNRTRNLYVDVHAAAGLQHDPCAQSLLASLYRSGNHVYKSLEQSIYILENALANPQITEEIKKEVYDQLDQIVNEFVSQETLILHIEELKIYIKAIYMFIPLLAAIDPMKAIKYYDAAEANCVHIFAKDQAVISMSQSEFYSLEQSCGSYAAIKQLALKNNMFALNELLKTVYARYAAELKRHADNEKIITTRETDQYVEQIKAELYVLVELFINLIHDKKIFADLKKDSVSRSAVDNSFDIVIEIMKSMNEPVEKFSSFLHQAIEFNPKNGERVAELWNLICCKEENVHLAPEKCFPILVQYADRNEYASLQLFFAYAPHWMSLASKFVDKDLEQALKYLVQAARLGAENAVNFLKNPTELTTEVDPFTIYGNQDQDYQTKAILHYIKAKGYDGDNKQMSLVLIDLEKVVKNYKLPMAAMVAAMQYQKLHDDYKAYEMLIELIKITHGLLPRAIVDDVVDMVQNFARADDPKIKAFAANIGDFLAKTRIELAAKKDFDKLIPNEGVSDILNDLLPRIPGLQIMTKTAR